VKREVSPSLCWSLSYLQKDWEASIQA
jgi:hypothetical protein